MSATAVDNGTKQIERQEKKQISPAARKGLDCVILTHNDQLTEYKSTFELLI